MKNSTPSTQDSNAPASMTRREFTRKSVHALVAFSLIETLCRRNLFAGSVHSEMVNWLNEVNQEGETLRKAATEQEAWRAQIESLFRQVDLPELLKFIDFSSIDQKAKPPKNGAQSIRFKYPKIEGVPSKLMFGQQIFALGKGRSVVPHGHNNMATAFLILKGDFHGKHWDRVDDEEEHLILKPTIDREFAPGTTSSISDYKDNVHWFKALSGPAYIFNIHVSGLDIGTDKRTGRVYVDPNGEKIDGGLIRARRVSYKKAHKLYG